jgi:hypothetical protein
MWVGLKWLLGLGPCGCHISATWQPRLRHVSAIWQPRQCHVAATLAPCGSHVEPRVCHISTRCLPHHLHVIYHISACHLPTHLYKWCGKLIHDGHFRHRFWALGWVHWALHQSMTVWKRHGLRQSMTKTLIRHERWFVMLNPWRNEISS